MKNRIIYWGGNDHTIIPRMSACGEGVDADPNTAYDNTATVDVSMFDWRNN